MLFPAEIRASAKYPALIPPFGPGLLAWDDVLGYRIASSMRFGSSIGPSFAAGMLAVACSSSSSSDSATTPRGGDDAGAATPAALSDDGTPPECTSGAGGSPLPNARGDVAGALDPSARRFVVHGGDVAVPLCGQPPTPKWSNETWVLDVACGTWRSVPAGDASPGPRSRHAMISDDARNRAILFGGRYRTGSSGAYTLYDDVWAFDFASETWSKIATTGKGPSARSNATVVVDGDKLVVFGGNTSTDGLSFAPQNDAYVLDLKTNEWSAVAAGGTKPAPRLFHTMAVDRQSHVAYVYGGGDEQAFTGPFLKDLWALDLGAGTWREIKTSGDAPVPRIHAGMTFDATDKMLVVFGGHDDGKLGNQNDVHRIDPASGSPTWARAGGGDVFNKGATGTCDFPPDFTKVDKSAPERRSAFAFGARSDGRGFVAAFGKSDCGVVADAWWWSEGPQTFKALRENPIGLSCVRYSTTCTALCN